jgi:hypothetical protein
VAATRKRAKPAARRPRKRAPGPPARGPAVRKSPARAAPRKAAPGAALRLAGVGGAAVLKATGRAWEEWLQVLDRAGARRLPHKEIALLLSRRFSVPNWWSQMVTVGYEQARGLREAHQTAAGFSANASRTVGAGLARLYTAWSDPALRERWLPGAPLEVTRSTDGKSMRMRWTRGDSRVEVDFYAKGPDKSMVAVQQNKLASAAAVARQKTFWTEALGRMKTLVEGGR